MYNLFTLQPTALGQLTRVRLVLKLVNSPRAAINRRPSLESEAEVVIVWRRERGKHWPRAL